MKDLQKIANDFFAANPDVEKVYVTTDGFVFLTQNAAHLHKTTNANQKKLEVKVFENNAPAKGKEPKPVKLTAEQRIEKIKAMTSVEEIDAFIKGDKAKTVLAAAEAKKAELLSGSKAPEVRGDEVNAGNLTGADDTDTGSDNTDTQNDK